LVSVPKTRYAQSGSLQIAYQVVGDGPVDLLFSPWWWNNLDTQWDDPLVAAFLERLASFSRLILFDQRGVGLSDPVPLAELPTLEQWMDDMRVVLDAVGSSRAAVLGHGDGGLVSILFAATFPERTSALVLVDSCARLRQDGDYSGWLDEGVEFFLHEFGTTWGSGALIAFLAPDLVGDAGFLERLARAERLSVSPTAAVAIQRVILDSDVRGALPTVSAPTLVLHRKDNTYAPAVWGRYLAAHIGGARYVELPGGQHLYWLGATTALLDEVEEFLTGQRNHVRTERVLATVLFSDIVGSTELAARLGDREWGELLGRFRSTVRSHLERFRGREINTRGDDFLATFDGPARAIRCAHAITQAGGALGVAIRSGLHTGEVELIDDDDIGGIAVHIGARVSAIAQSGEVLVSRTVVDLVAGSGITFDDRGEHELKGVPGSWRLFSARR
jgi:class 3 adenylate cyclase